MKAICCTWCLKKCRKSKSKDKNDRKLHTDSNDESSENAGKPVLSPESIVDERDAKNNNASNVKGKSKSDKNSKHEKNAAKDGRALD